MNTKTLFLFFLFATLCCSSLPAEESPQSVLDRESSGTLEPFKSDPNIEKQLGPSTRFAGYSISPPRGYVQVLPPEAPAATQFAGWVGTRRTDGSTPMIQVTVFTPPAQGETPELTENIVRMLLAGVKRRRTNWTETETVYGTIGGIPFAQKKWKGKDKATGTEMRGTMFIGLDGAKIIQLHTQDLVAHPEAIQLGESSLMTFARKEP
ncbi:MAG: hypothetical protein AAF733_11185 [Verrucomicrobiota bacterium]